MEKSRTEYSTMNTVVAMISRIAAILMGFVTRVVFTHTLSESYVGINGLFTDILNVLSLTELGVETAISYALYRPIAQTYPDRSASVKLNCSFIPDGISDLTGYLSDRHFIYDTQLYFFPEYLYCMYTAL